MNRKRSEPELEFFSTGAKTYLDVEEAVEEFRRQVQERCGEVAQLRLADIARACDQEWVAGDLKDYKQKDDSGRYLGKSVVVEGLGGDLTLHFRTYRDQREVAFGLGVGLSRKRGDLAPDLWSRANANQRSRLYLSFGNQSLTVSQVSDFETHLHLAIDDFIEFMTRAGGLKKYLP
jgi:hypothetical protein